MLTLTEKILFSLAILASVYAATRAVTRLIKIISRGSGKPDWKLVWEHLVATLVKTLSLKPTWRLRLGTSLMHALVVWGFTYYLLVNVGDLLQAYIPDFTFLGHGELGNLYRLGADLLSVGVLTGMALLLTRRFILKPEHLKSRQDILLHPKTRRGISRDSAIVGGFILLHVDFRFLGESFHLAPRSHPDPWQPLATSVSRLWSGWDPEGLLIAQHLSFWIAMGLILAFIPYFPRSKHIHLFFAPLNFLLKPKRRSIGELASLDFEDENIDMFGVTKVEDFSWEQLMDAYACIMCYRCQQVCPAYHTGKVLSPAALEINKRYFLNTEGDRLTKGNPSGQPLTDFAISEEAIWACTACGACIDICPVGNEPMRDILDIRRALVLMDNNFPDPLQTAFRGMERTVNPWNVPPTERMTWAEGFSIPTIEDHPNPDILWWVGCAPATESNAQKTARAFAKILNTAKIDFAVLGEMESCIGDSARRAGNEYLFFELASRNVETLNQIAPKLIVTTCPHCLHTLKNEYPAFGGNYQVIHHTQLINDLLWSGRLHLGRDAAGDTITLHDPCYLGRQNGILVEPRLSLRQTGARLSEMPRAGLDSFCCGAGGAQIWKEEEAGEQSINHERYHESSDTGVDTLAVACPFCMVMMNDAAKESDHKLKIMDIAEIIAANLE